MRYVSIKKLEPGMILAKAVYDEADRVLLGAGSILTREFIRKLEQRGFQGLYIDDELSKEVHIEETISQELRNKGIRSLRDCDVDASLDVAKCIVDQIINSKTISLDMVDLRDYDNYTYSHSVNVAVLSTVIGIGLNLKEEDLVNLSQAAILHDLGKLMVPEDILNKPGRLTGDEFEIMKNHPILSYNLIKDRWDISAKTKVGVLFHHENEDGTGYPKALSGNEIMVYAKIIHVADVYDALISRRPYKKPYSFAEAYEYIMANNGVMFAPGAVKAFIKYVPIYPKGIDVTLSDGRKGFVEGNTNNTARPVVRLYDGMKIDLSDLQHYRNITLHEEVDELETCFS